MDTLPSLVNHQHTRSVLEYGKRGTTRQEAQCSNRHDADMARSQDKDRNGAKGTWGHGSYTRLSVRGRERNRRRVPASYIVGVVRVEPDLYALASVPV